MVALVLFMAPRLWAQGTEIALLGGAASSADLESRASEFQSLKLARGFALGGAVTRFFSPHVGAEISFVRAHSAISLTTSTDEADLFDVNIGQLHGSFVYQFGGADARVRPFVFGGAGAAFLSATDLDGETKFAWSAGGGLRWFPGAKTGVRLHVRYNGIRLNDASSSYCDPFGFCQATLRQFEVMGGVVLRF